MGFGPREVETWSLCEFALIARAWSKANSVEAGPAPPTEEDLREAVARHTLH